MSKVKIFGKKGISLNSNFWYLFHYLRELQMSTEVTLGDFMGKSTVLVSQK